MHHLAGLGRKRGLSTFSVEFDDPEYYEFDAQQAVVRHYGTRHRVARIGSADVAEGFPAAVLHAETALFRSAPVPMLRLSKEVRAAGIKVVMSGEGADEILLGYDLFREGRRSGGSGRAIPAPAAAVSCCAASTTTCRSTRTRAIST